MLATDDAIFLYFASDHILDSLKIEVATCATDVAMFSCFCYASDQWYLGWTYIRNLAADAAVPWILRAINLLEITKLLSFSFPRDFESCTVYDT